MNANLPTLQELTDMRNLMLLHMCVETLESRLMRAIREEERNHTQRILDAVSADYRALRKQLHDANITLYFDQLKDIGYAVKYPFICRGYNDFVGGMKDHYRAEIREKLKEYKV